MYRVSVLILAGLVTAAALTAAVTGRTGAAEDDEYLGLPNAPGREEVVAYCAACHSLKLVVQQGLTRQSWAETLTWMYEEQEMPELEPAEEKLVLDYLAKYVGPEGQKERLRQRGVIN